MSATGFQRRRRELALANSEAKPDESGVTGGEVPPVAQSQAVQGGETQKPEGEGNDTVTPPVPPEAPPAAPEAPAVTPPEQVPLTEQTTTTATTGLAAMSKDELLSYIGKRKLFEKSYKQLEPDAIIPLFLKAVQAKIVAAKLKTDIEVAALPEKELLELLDTLK